MIFSWVKSHIVILCYYNGSSQLKSVLFRPAQLQKLVITMPCCAEVAQLASTYEGWYSTVLAASVNANRARCVLGSSFQ